MKANTIVLAFMLLAALFCHSVSADSSMARLQKLVQESDQIEYVPAFIEQAPATATSTATPTTTTTTTAAPATSTTTTAAPATTTTTTAAPATTATAAASNATSATTNTTAADSASSTLKPAKVVRLDVHGFPVAESQIIHPEQPVNYQPVTIVDRHVIDQMNLNPVLPVASAVGPASAAEYHPTPYPHVHIPIPTPASATANTVAQVLSSIPTPSSVSTLLGDAPSTPSISSARAAANAGSVGSINSLISGAANSAASAHVVHVVHDRESDANNARTEALSRAAVETATKAYAAAARASAKAGKADENAQKAQLLASKARVSLVRNKAYVNNIRVSLERQVGVLADHAKRSFTIVRQHLKKTNRRVAELNKQASDINQLKGDIKQITQSLTATNTRVQQLPRVVQLLYKFHALLQRFAVANKKSRARISKMKTTFLNEIKAAEGRQTSAVDALRSELRSSNQQLRSFVQSAIKSQNDYINRFAQGGARASATATVFPRSLVESESEQQQEEQQPQHEQEHEEQELNEMSAVETSSTTEHPATEQDMHEATLDHIENELDDMLKFAHEGADEEEH